MIELLIDSQSVDIDQKTSMAITLSLADIENVEESNTGYSKTFSIPMTPKNRVVFGFTEQVFSSTQFNNTKHSAKILSNGVTVMSGYAQITEYKNSNGSGVYSLNIIGDGFDWLVNAQKKMNELNADFSLLYVENEVYDNSILPITESPLIRFIPVDRGAFYNRNTEDELIPRTGLILQDYYPFINVWRLLELIMSGYSIVSSLENRLKNQYISGQLSEPEDMSELKEDNNFFAGTTFEAEERSMDNYIFLFNTFAPYGDKEYFTTGNILKIMNHVLPAVYNNIRFTPTDTIRVAFDINLLFTLNPRYIDEPLSFVFGYGDKQDTHVINRHEPVETTTAGFNIIGQLQYLKITKLPAGWSSGIGLTILCRLVCRCYNNSLWGDGVTVEIANMALSPAAKSDQYFNKVLPEGYSHYLFILVNENYHWSTGLRLWLDDNDVSAATVEYTAYYYNTMEARLTYDKPITTKVFSIVKGDYIDFKTKFNGYSGETIILGNECDIKPNFKNNLGYGEQVTIGVIGGEKTQLEFIQALRQMYNLIFYTNSLTKQVFIEPRPDFYIDKL
ncbi:MAG: hypothetical protein LBF04_04065 [Prevotellaceae bacterium]|jgi:hypothetical protein|nr:hypothetical protein [Prevotellaceae bacterium]